jgi:hypothetical protein
VKVTVKTVRTQNEVHESQYHCEQVVNLYSMYSFRLRNEVCHCWSDTHAVQSSRLEHSRSRLELVKTKSRRGRQANLRSIDACNLQYASQARGGVNPAFRRFLLCGVTECEILWLCDFIQFPRVTPTFNSNSSTQERKRTSSPPP